MKNLKQTARADFAAAVAAAGDDLQTFADCSVTSPALQGDRDAVRVRPLPVGEVGYLLDKAVRKLPVK